MRDTQRQRYRQRLNEAPCGEPDVGLDPPGPRVHDLSQSRCSTTEAPRCLADSIPLLVMGLFTFSISSYFSFARLHISRDLSISSRSPSLLVYNFIVFPYHCLIFLVLVVISLLSFVILFIYVISLFSLIRLARAWSILLIIFKKHLLVSLFHSTVLLFLHCLFPLSSLFFPFCRL